ncbi:MAG TPA: Uma2 family endonuclease [Fimbriiglobus sp.]|nr:Uma2 family endonuclease [Fimbriiglobus sp.]
MSTVLVPPSAAVMPPRPLLWTVAEFHRIAETGVFEGRRPILIRGVLLEQGPMNPPHALAIEHVMEALRVAFGAGWRIRVQLPLVLGLETDPLPDVAMIPGSVRGASDHPTTAALVVEVSDTTLALDLTEKAELYATAGIADYWVLDVTSRRLLVFRDPAPIAAGGAAYRTHLTLAPTDSISPLAATGATIAVADLMP